MKKIEAILEWGGIKRDIIFLLISGLALLADFLNMHHCLLTLSG